MNFNAITNSIKNKIENIQKADQKKNLKIKDITLIPEFEKLLVMDDSVVNAMTESMKTEGFKPGHELHIWAHDGKYILIDGHTRRHCAIKAGLTSVPCIIHHFDTLEEAKKFAIREQTDRRNLSGEALLQAVANFNFEKGKGNAGGERLEEQRLSQDQRDDDFLDKKRTFQNEKAMFEQEKESSSQKAVEQYDEYMKSEKFQNADFPSLPIPESKKGVWSYHLRIRPVFDAIVSKAKQFFEQIKSLKKSHQEELQKLKDEYQADLEKTKANAEAEKLTTVKTEVEKAVLSKAAEKDETINSLKEEIQKEKTEMEKWYTMLFRKFTIKIGGKQVEVNKGLTDAYIEKSTQLAEWENHDGDEFITLGTSYKKYRVHNRKDYLKEKARPRTLDYDMSR